MSEPLIVQSGAIHVYRQFDIADEIDLPRVQALTQLAAGRLKLSRMGSQYIELPNPPVALHLGTRTVELSRGGRSVDLYARVFDHGAVSILLRLPIEAGTSLEATVPLLDELFDSPVVDSLARVELEGLFATLRSALTKPHVWEGSEGYHVLFVERFSGRTPTAAQLTEEAPLANLLLGETAQRPLSAGERWDVTQHAFSYLEDDLAVIDWNCAFVYEPSGSHDLPDMLEIANAQLLELRYFDERLDRELTALYDEVSRQPRSRLRKLLRSDYTELQRKAMVQMLEIAEFTERVENSLKVIGDFYLARVYHAAVRRLRIPAWQESVDRKEALLAQIYDVLRSEVEQSRMLFLEATIVGLILLEIVLAAMKLV